MPNRLLRAIVAGALLAALLPAGAGAARPAERPPPADFQALYDEYQNLGVILGCSHRESDLRSALSAVPADIKAYDPGFVDALNAALEARATSCKNVLASPFAGGGAAGNGTVIASDGSPGPPGPPIGVPLPAPEGSGVAIPAALLALAAVAGAAVVGAAGFFLGRRRGRPLIRHH